MLLKRKHIFLFLKPGFSNIFIRLLALSPSLSQGIEAVRVSVRMYPGLLSAVQAGGHFLGFQQCGHSRLLFPPRASRLHCVCIQHTGCSNLLSLAAVPLLPVS